MGQYQLSRSPRMPYSAGISTSESQEIESGATYPARLVSIMYALNYLCKISEEWVGPFLGYFKRRFDNDCKSRYQVSLLWCLLEHRNQQKELFISPNKLR